ncbi:hypothetical protein Tco_0243947, partial [Tanacetum coccineum]
KLVVTSFNEFKESDQTSPSSASELMARYVRYWRLVSKDWRFGSDLRASWYEFRSWVDVSFEMESVQPDEDDDGVVGFED